MFPCKRLSRYFYAPVMDLCLSGEVSSRKHHNCTSCVTVNGGATTSHFLALNELCLQGMMQFIGPIHDCLTSCLHTLLYFPLTGEVQSMSTTTPPPPPFHHSNPMYTSMHARDELKTPDLLGHVKGSSPARLLLHTTAAPAKDADPLKHHCYVQICGNKRPLMIAHLSRDETIPSLRNKSSGNNKNNFNVFTDGALWGSSAHIHPGVTDSEPGIPEAAIPRGPRVSVRVPLRCPPWRVSYTGPSASAASDNSLFRLPSGVCGPILTLFCLHPFAPGLVRVHTVVSSSHPTTPATSLTTILHISFYELTWEDWDYNNDLLKQMFCRVYYFSVKTNEKFSTFPLLLDAPWRWIQEGVVYFIHF